MLFVWGTGIKDLIQTKMKKEVFISIWGGIKILKWKLVLGTIAGVTMGICAVFASLCSDAFNEKPILKIFMNILFFCLGFIAGFLPIIIRYKKPPEI